MTTTTVRPRTPVELAVVLPYQLGYHPQRSVVLAVLHGRRLGMVQRHDLPDPRDCDVVAAHAVGIAVREGATGILLLGFEDVRGISDPLLDAMTAAAAECDLEVGHRLVVRDGHGHLRRPDGGTDTQVLPRPEDVPAVAPFVRAGVCPLPSREHLVHGLLPPRDEGRATAVATARHPLGVDPTDDMLVRGWTRLLDPGDDAVPVRGLRDDELLLLGTSLLVVGWRDALMTVLCPGALSVDAVPAPHLALALRACGRCGWAGPGADGAHEHHDDLVAVRQRLGELCALTPIELTPDVLALTALLVWWMGDGTLAGVCLERALEVDPEHTLAGLLMSLLGEGIRPWAPRDDLAA